ncbi:lamin tail domain-containing protein [Chryseobacterium turcicum]|uniref:Lamin tail domain-containing protein n=1 Tax=Chryseobacterium turcicum TaxID=2898076 RepID=A0A9Q3YY97_9FLAO|nr:lamin tail domain-containing protein [Chryseobacterium turcicum]MCD1116115.1 lamin tail domain-containing protein [Chryseobacterium turcicum]
MKKVFIILGIAFSAIMIDAQVSMAQIYANGGNSGATYNRDFVVLFNKTSSAVNMSGWSIQYGSATSTASWSGKVTLPAGATIAPYSYYLVGLASNNVNTGAVLPVAVDFDGGLSGSGTVNLGGNGKVALMSNDTTINGASPTGAIDFVGMGTANASEGTDTSVVGSATNSIFRLNGGCTDTNNNGADFIIGAVNPINSSAAVNNCGTLSITDVVLSKSNFIKNTFVKNDEITFGADAKEVKIYTLTGQLVKTASVKANGTLNIAELAEGNYIVTGTVNNQAVSQKILKN